ncbi:MAG: hypothetical protein AB7U75_01845 [Hyphomicrobiaceae bacterium]
MSVKTRVLSTLASGALLAIASLPSSAALNSGNDDRSGGTTQLISLFKSTCYDTVPNVEAVEAAAQIKGWTELTGAALAPFKPAVTPRTLKAWRLHQSGKAYSVAYAVSDVDEKVAALLPDFAGAQAYSCSVISAAMDHDAATRELKDLVGRANDSEFDQGPLKARMWVGVNDELAVFLYHYRPASGGKNGLINITAIPKR